MGFIGKKHGYSVYRCPNCSFVSVDVQFFNPFEVYGPGYLSGKYQGTASYYQDYFSKEPTLRQKFRKILNIIGKEGNGRTLFEMGCGAGFFLDEARAVGYVCSGTEVSIEAFEHCKKLGLDVSKRKFLPSESFNVTVAIDVVEHLPNPLQILRALYEMCSDYLVIETVFSDGINDLLNWEMMQPPRHVSFLRKEHINSLFDLKPKFYKIAYGTLCIWNKRSL
jgi:hypothetical protein